MADKFPLVAKLAKKITVDINANTSPYFEEWYKDLKNGLETEKQFLDRMVKQCAYDYRFRKISGDIFEENEQLKNTDQTILLDDYTKELAK